MTKRVRKYQVVDKLCELSYCRVHTLRKTWEQVDGTNRRGWFVATLHGWKYLGETLALAMERLELEQEENRHLTDTELDEQLAERNRETEAVTEIAHHALISLIASLGH